jgi:hypothetical protein
MLEVALNVAHKATIIGTFIVTRDNAQVNNHGDTHGNAYVNVHDNIHGFTYENTLVMFMGQFFVI